MKEQRKGAPIPTAINKQTNLKKMESIFVIHAGPLPLPVPLAPLPSVTHRPPWTGFRCFCRSAPPLLPRLRLSPLRASNTLTANSVANLTCARKDPGDYWKNIMKGQPMPEPIKDLVMDPQVSNTGKDHFIRDFDIKPNVILYHTHVMSKQHKQKPIVKNIEAEFKKLHG